MSLPEKDLEKLLAMQVLCDEVIEQTRALARIPAFIRSLNRNLRRLEAFYGSEWTSLYLDERVSEEDDRAIQAVIKEGNYSILSQDTIWDALQEAYHHQMVLAKTAVKNLKG